jgi:uncharacterized protein YhdP
VQRLTAALSGTDARGRIALRSQHAVLTWPRMFLKPLAAESLRADFAWTREGREWRLDTQDLRLERPGLVAHGSAGLNYVSAAVSPYLALNLDVDSADMRLVPDVLPVGRPQGAVARVARAGVRRRRSDRSRRVARSDPQVSVPLR